MPILRALAIPLVLIAYAGLFLPAAAAFRLGAARRGASQTVLARLLLALLRIRVDASGLERIPSGAMLVANHISWLDILVLSSLRPARFLAKAEVGAWPLVAAIARAHGVIHVDRRRRRSILPANRAMADALACGETVLFFPEGTTGCGASLLPFRSSHFEAACEAARRSPDAVAVVPLALAYEHPRAAWVGDDALLPHVWEMLTSPPSVCRVGTGAARPVTPACGRKQVARDLEGRVEALRAELSAVSLPAPAP